MCLTCFVRLGALGGGSRGVRVLSTHTSALCVWVLLKSTSMRRPVISRVQSTLLCIARPRTWCGVACFNLSELLNPRLVEAAVLQGLPPAPESALQRLVHPLPLRADVEPQRASLTKSCFKLRRPFLSIGQIAIVIFSRSKAASFERWTWTSGIPLLPCPM